MFESPILIYSNYCNHSQKFITVLKENPEVGRHFVSINIDVDPQTRQRPGAFYEIQKALDFKISEVPTIIVDDGQYVLSGEEAFKWIEHEIQSNAPEDLSAFNPNEMSSFSDNYSPYGERDMNNASDQTFCFVNKVYDTIPTPPEDAIPKMSQDEYNQKQKLRDNVKIAGSAKMGHSDTYSRQQPTRANANASKRNGSKNPKKNEIDNRLEELMMERDQLNRAAPPPKNIDFSNGRM